MLFRRHDRKAPLTRGAEWIELMLDDGPLRVAVRRHPQARRLTLRVRAAARDVTLTAPPHVPLAFAHDFVQRHREWVRVRLVRLPEPVPFADGAIIPLRGEPHRIVHRPEARGTVWIAPAQEDGEPATLNVAGDAPHLSRRVQDFLKREARHDLGPAVRRYAAALKVEVGRITLRDTASRWGSCSAQGDLSFSWRLILAPAFVLDYLAAHEVAHRLEMNHGPRYWRLVEQVCPARREAEAWLRRNGSDLHRYGGA
ncbi:M48 family metallopeptidase [Xanthobacter dioxanivorans]|uniref:M48 family metallopeptidase n=1 Tax=Xanthobacter dioxanivorans TaxID=2528964 RepID=A0A974PRA5_9HYPH|nr:SprT family zinc-dependent metalloprotease [Xanthobacter dioxanivorans]QRG08031.1 M48 family metallopeptidase [Xanthobacter dioxanivorans]